MRPGMAQAQQGMLNRNVGQHHGQFDQQDRPSTKAGDENREYGRTSKSPGEDPGRTDSPARSPVSVTEGNRGAGIFATGPRRDSPNDPTGMTYRNDPTRSDPTRMIQAG
jgi:hypothetical protein